MVLAKPGEFSELPIVEYGTITTDKEAVNRAAGAYPNPTFHISFQRRLGVDLLRSGGLDNVFHHRFRSTGYDQVIF